MKWIKPSGREIEINDDEPNRKYAESLGWKPVNGNGDDPVVPEHETGLTDVDSAPDQDAD